MGIRKRSGFTLIEIMIVVAIIGLLAAIAVPNFQQARTTAQKNTCLDNLRKIDLAKDQYALDSNVNAGLTPSDSALDPYVKGGIQTAKKCPSGGTVFINAIGSDPTCTTPNHSLSGVSTAGGGAVVGFLNSSVVE